MNPPKDPIAAVTHRDPYPYYADLARRPLNRDPGLGLWVAAGAEAIIAVLTSPLCRVRPAGEPVPSALHGSPAGEIFARMVRLTDGAGHCPLKRAVIGALDGADLRAAGRAAADWARRLGAETDDPTRLAFAIPAYVIGRLLGLPEDRLAEAERLLADFVRCIAPGNPPDLVRRGTAAAGPLLDLVRAHRGGGLTATLIRAGLDETMAAANGVGFLVQVYEATAGLIANMQVLLARRPELRTRPMAEVALETLRLDPPTHNTRRFVAADGVVAGQEMKAGEAILVVLASASGHVRHEGGFLVFGAGAHACPGERLALAIAAGAVEALIADGPDWDRLGSPTGYRPSANIRIPLFA